jgi:DNA modification methylase
LPGARSMKKHTLAPGVTLFHADCRDALRSLPDNSIDAVPCDPPYELNFMGKGWDDTGIANDPALWAEVFRVLKPGGHLAAFSASRTYHRMACAIEDAGFEIRDSLMWIYGTGFPKSQNVARFIDAALGAEPTVVGFDTVKAARFAKSALGTQNAGWDRPWMHEPDAAQRKGQITAATTPQAQEFDGFGTALKPAFEPIVLARKPLSEGTVAANVLRWRTGALNIDGCRVPGAKPDTTRGASSKASSMVGTLGAQGRIEDDGMGRWPANVVTDGSDEVVGMFPTTNPSRIGKPRGAAAGDGWGMTHTGAEYSDSGSAARFFFNAAETDTTWLAQNLPSDLARNAVSYSSLPSELAASVLNRAVEQSTRHWELIGTDCLEPSTSVTPNELRQLAERITEIILTIGEKCSPESPPKRLSQSDNLASIAATREPIDTIRITASLLKSNGSAAPATFNITLINLAVRERVCAPYISRFHYSAKASKADRNGSKHPTVKPISLMQWLARLITPPGGTILDPFAGSGTTGAAAVAEGFSVVLCERESEYVADIKRRLGRFDLDAALQAEHEARRMLRELFA